MARPPSSDQTIAARQATAKARALLGSPSMPPDEFDGSEEEVTTGGTPVWAPEAKTGGAFTVVSEQARSFRNEAYRLIFLLAVLGVAAWLVHAGVIQIGPGK